MDHDHARRVALEEVVRERDEHHHCCGWGVQGEPGQSLDEGRDERGGEVTVCAVTWDQRWVQGSEWVGRTWS